MAQNSKLPALARKYLHRLRPDLANAFEEHEQNRDFFVNDKLGAKIFI